MKKFEWKKRLIQAAWILAGIGTIVLMGAAMQHKNRKKCTDIRIEISGIEEHMFIDEKDVLELIQTKGKVKGTAVASLNLRAMETSLETNPWVRNAEMYIDNQQVLQVQIEERQPIARVFTVQGSSFYLDSSGMRLPLSEKLSARVPMFTGYPSDNIKLSKPDSLLLRDIVTIGQYILADSFWMAQVAQIDIEPGRQFEMIPVVGDHIVAIGNADELDAKFNRLYTFYKQAWLQKGIHYYERLNVQYDKQVVAVKRGTTAMRQDSAAALELIRQMTAPVDPLAVIPAPVTVSVSKDSSSKPTVVPVVDKPVQEKAPVKTITNNNNKINTNPLSKKVTAKPADQKKEAVKPKAVMKRSE
jgi:cell division protein FtsQ